ncbi:hypothetical protein ASPCAL07684 [Aspergillus calidoustus]|uniref:Uncharacterized protein n=1 Tax=Aspergillus calidoustus TaxID=454130 RepID=A0A0U5GQN7_ASPCI|nr:hypothetical protein ASPCAL07684 [Aspergillus calidoustus]
MVGNLVSIRLNDRPSMTAAPKTPRVIIIGAGWTGLAAAKTYLQIRPNADLTILDEESEIGGVWSRNRVYPGFIADSPVGLFDYSDLPMGPEIGLDDWADLPASRVNAYMEGYVDRFKLREQCRFNAKVIRVQRGDVGEGGERGWRVEVEDRSNGSSGQNTTSEVLYCDKLIVATGTTSTPWLPDDIDWTRFSGTVLHSKEVGQKHGYLTSPSVSSITVVGGNKSAVDVVNLCALAGKQVNWVIREEGWGPGFLLKARSKNGDHLGTIKSKRVSGLASPSILSAKGFGYWFLHSGRNWIGPRLLNWVFEHMAKTTIKEVYGQSENTMKIVPDLKHLFWNQSGVSVVHDDKFMEMVAEGNLIPVHRTSVSSLQDRSVQLADGQVLPCDAIVFATGWQRNQLSLFDHTTLTDLGLPQKISDQLPDVARHWKKLDTSSRSQISKTFPALASPPPDVVAYLEQKRDRNKARSTPFRLFRYIVPPKLAAEGDRSLIVLGLVQNTTGPLYAEISSLWGIAYLEDLPFSRETQALLSNQTAMEQNISLVNTWGEMMTLNMAEGYPDRSGEIQDFTDLLMKDLGLRPDRKRFAAEKDGNTGILGLRGWYKEWFGVYKAQDYQGVVEEYLRKVSSEAHGLKA